MSASSEGMDDNWAGLLESDTVSFSDDMFESPGQGSHESEDLSQVEAVDIKLPPGFGLNNYEAVVDNVVDDSRYKSEGSAVRIIETIEEATDELREGTIKESREAFEKGRPIEGVFGRALSELFNPLFIGPALGPVCFEVKKQNDIKERVKMPDVKAVNRLDDGETNPIYVDSQVISYHESDDGRWARVYSTGETDIALASDVYSAINDYEA